MSKVFEMSFARLYPVYINKLTRKGRTEAELIQVTCWLTGYSKSELKKKIKGGVTLREFFDTCSLNPLADQITGSICGVKIQEIEDPLMKQIRYLDKLVDELAKGRPMEKVLRTI